MDEKVFLLCISAEPHVACLAYVLLYCTSVDMLIWEIPKMSVWHHHWSGRLYVVVLGSYKHPRMAQRNFLLLKNNFAPRMPSGLIVICCLYTLNVYFDKLFVICTGALMAATFEKLDTFFRSLLSSFRQENRVYQPSDLY